MKECYKCEKYTCTGLDCFDEMNECEKCGLLRCKKCIKEFGTYMKCRKCSLLICEKCRHDALCADCFVSKKQRQKKARKTEKTFYIFITSCKEDPFPTIEDSFHTETEALDALLSEANVESEEENGVISELVEKGGFASESDVFYSIREVGVPKTKVSRDPRMEQARLEYRK